MRLWHEEIIKFLPRQQLLGQHRECCALRGNGWGRAHATVNYVFSYSPYKLFQYHLLIMDEMKRRGYQPNKNWENALFRGNRCDQYQQLDAIEWSTPIYSEHNNAYKIECLENLKHKGIHL